jgi:hypothetical protein
MIYAVIANMDVQNDENVGIIAVREVEHRPVA